MKLPPEGTFLMRSSTARAVPAVDTAPVETTRHHPHVTTAILAAIPFAVAILALQTSDAAHRAWFAEEDNVAENLQFAFLLVGEPLDTAMFRGVVPGRVPGELAETADEAVRVFLAAYRSERNSSGSDTAS